LKRRPRLFRYLSALCAAGRRFFAEVPGSIRDHLNSEELLRITITALTAGGGVCGILEAILARTTVIFPAPADAALAAALLAAILEANRRLRHGDEVVLRGARSRFSH
jgi:hypothetical protein